MIQFENVKTFFGGKCKATFKTFFQHFMGFFMPFCFQALIKGKQVSI
jgi:hypothetical protein